MADDHYKQYIGRKFVAVSIVLSLLFWIVFTRLLLPFVPAMTLNGQYLGAGFTALCLTGVFYIALHMFRLVWVEHQRNRRS